MSEENRRAALAQQALLGPYPAARSGGDEERAALAAGTHEPAVDDFGNQYLARTTPPSPAAGGLREALRHLDNAVEIIEAADRVAEAADGPVAHVRDILSDGDWRTLYTRLYAARGCLRAALAPVAGSGIPQEDTRSEEFVPYALTPFDEVEATEPARQPRSETARKGTL